MITICNLTKNYGSLCAVDSLSLHVPRGELFCFLGPNGAGKTTTIKMLTGLLHPTSGSMMIDGLDPITNAVDTKRKIGYIPDMPFLYDRLTTTEFFEFIGDLYSIPPDTVKTEHSKYFEMFGLMEYKSALVKDLSHGLRQRLLYASTFLHDPKVMFIDEPLIGLDPYTIRMIKDLLIRKTRNGMTVFLTTHILALAEDIADRIGIITRGHLMVIGSVKELARQTGCKDLESAFLQITGNQEGMN